MRDARGYQATSWQPLLCIKSTQWLIYKLITGDIEPRPWLIMFHCRITCLGMIVCRSQWPRGLRRRSSAARLLRLWVRIPPGAWMFVCCECCVLSGIGLCDGLITRPEESYRLWRVVVCDQETSNTRRLKPAIGL